ncbi:MAG: glycosyltransferase [Pseudomonadota bacterium]
MGLGSTHSNHRAPRIMLYSHDTFGLGHLRRSRTLAGEIVQALPGSSALIITGSPVAGRFAFSDGVDHIRLPGVIKRSDGSYVSHALDIDIDTTTNLRAALIRAAVNEFNPDIIIVDKEPTGFRGELLPTLEDLKSQGRTQLVLGLRDVLDEPHILKAEWQKKEAIEATERFYDEIWVYGLRSIYDPVDGLGFGPETRARMHWTGYLRRHLHPDSTNEPYDDRYILVTPGGGGDGFALVNLVLSAYEADPFLQPKAVVVYGPFLSGETRQDFEERVARLNGRVVAVGFESQIETLYSHAEGVICMGGYNTFCEVMSFDKPAVIVPRTVPRLEQYIRASRAEELGLVRMLDDRRDGLTTATMISAIRGLQQQNPPSFAMPDGLLSGLDVVTARVKSLLSDRAKCAAE